MNEASDLPPTRDVNVAEFRRVVTPRQLRAAVPATHDALEATLAGRDEVRRVLRGEDRRLLVVVGPCSVHDPDAAVEYAERLRALRARVEDRLLLVMRVYFEKPRTTTGWKGLINDPHLDGSFDVNAGLRKARELLVRVNQLGVPCATELLDPIVPQYLADLLAWAAIGARTTESQTHRAMASGLSMPVGFKNGTDGSVQTAVDALRAAAAAHCFLGCDEDGATCIVQSRGNPDGHLVLRGGTARPNYDPATVADAAERLRAVGLRAGLMIDCSHANSGKKHENQAAVWRSVVEQARAPGSPVIGAMIESNLEAGRQDVVAGAPLRRGVSITDACIGWEETRALLEEAR